VYPRKFHDARAGVHPKSDPNRNANPLERSTANAMPSWMCSFNSLDADDGIPARTKQSVISASAFFKDRSYLLSAVNTLSQDKTTFTLMPEVITPPPGGCVNYPIDFNGSGDMIFPQLLAVIICNCSLETHCAIDSKPCDRIGPITMHYVHKLLLGPITVRKNLQQICGLFVEPSKQKIAGPLHKPTTWFKRSPQVKMKDTPIVD
jgi:hypothetical protein